MSAQVRCHYAAELTGYYPHGLSDTPEVTRVCGGEILYCLRCPTIPDRRGKGRTDGEGAYCDLFKLNSSRIKLKKVEFEILQVTFQSYFEPKLTGSRIR